MLSISVILPVGGASTGLESWPAVTPGGFGEEQTYNILDLLPPVPDEEIAISERIHDLQEYCIPAPVEFADQLSYTVNNSEPTPLTSTATIHPTEPQLHPTLHSNLGIIHPSQSTSAAPSHPYTENEIISVKCDWQLEQIEDFSIGQIIVLEYAHEKSFITSQCARLNGILLPKSNFIAKTPVHIEINHSKQLSNIKNVGLNQFVHITDGSVQNIDRCTKRLGISNISHSWYGKIRKVNGICKDDRKRLKTHICYLGTKYSIEALSNLCHKTVLESFGRSELYRPSKICPACGLLVNNKHTPRNCKSGKFIDRNECIVKLFLGGQIYACQRAWETNHKSVHNNLNLHVSFFTDLPITDQPVPEAPEWYEIKNRVCPDSFTNLFWITKPLTDINLPHVIRNMLKTPLAANEISLSKKCKCQSRCLSQCLKECKCDVKCNCLHFLANNFYCLVHSSNPNDKYPSVKIGYKKASVFLKKHHAISPVAGKKHILLYIFSDNIQNICYKEGIKLINGLNRELFDEIKFTIIIISKYGSTLKMPDKSDMTITQL